VRKGDGKLRPSINCGLAGPNWVERNRALKQNTSMRRAHTVIVLRLCARLEVDCLLFAIYAGKPSALSFHSYMKVFRDAGWLEARACGRAGASPPIIPGAERAGGMSPPM